MLSDDIRADAESQAAAEDLDRQEAAQAQDFREPHMDCRKGRAARQKAADRTRGRYQDGDRQDDDHDQDDEQGDHQEHLRADLGGMFRV